MTTSVHANLTGSDLHEPKGAATALSGEVYVSNGIGGGVWTPASNVITNSAFTTGDLKQTHKLSPDAGWILWQDGSIGDGSSGASTRANADTAALFALYWSYSSAYTTVSGGRGVSAAADFAAHKTVTIPLGVGRALGICGGGAGLTSRNIGSVIGAETQTLNTANLPPYTPAGTGSFSTAVSAFPSSANGTAISGANTSTFGVNTTSISFIFAGTPQGGTSTAFSIMPPMAFINVMIKL